MFLRKSKNFRTFHYRGSLLSYEKNGYISKEQFDAEYGYIRELACSLMKDSHSRWYHKILRDIVSSNINELKSLSKSERKTFRKSTGICLDILFVEVK